MMVLIIGKNRVEYCRVKKRDLSKHFFTTRGQLYKIYPDALHPVEIHHDGAWTESESLIVFEENGTAPYHCKYPADYAADSILATIDEHKLMLPKRDGLRAWFRGSSALSLKGIGTWAPWAIVGFVVFYALVLS